MVLGKLEKYYQVTFGLLADALYDASAGALVGAFYRVPSSLCSALNSGLNDVSGRDLILSDRSLCELFGSMPISFGGEQISSDNYSCETFSSVPVSSDNFSRNESGNVQTLVTNTLSAYYSGGGGVFKYLKFANFEQNLKFKHQTTELINKSAAKFQKTFAVLWPCLAEFRNNLFKFLKYSFKLCFAADVFSCVSTSAVFSLHLVKRT